MDTYAANMKAAMEMGVDGGADKKAVRRFARNPAKILDAIVKGRRRQNSRIK